MIKRIGLVLCSSLFVMFLLDSCSEKDESYTVYVYNEAGDPVKGADVWVSYASVAKAPHYITDEDGRAYLDLREQKRTLFHSIIVGKNGKRANRFRDKEMQWPVRLTLK